PSRLPSRPGRSSGASRRLAGLGLPEPHPRHGPALPDDPSPPQRHPRCHWARLVELEAGGPELEDPLDQPPRLRPPFGGRDHRNDLPLLRRNHRDATHGKVRRTKKRAPARPMLRTSAYGTPLPQDRSGVGRNLELERIVSVILIPTNPASWSWCS